MLRPEARDIQVVCDRDVVRQKWYGCSDGTVTGYLKMATDDVLSRFLPFTRHTVTEIEV